MMKKFLIVKSNRKYKKLFVDEILYCKADGAYTGFYFSGDKETIWACYLLKEVESMLTEAPFFRVNRSYLVNLDHCHELICKTNEIVLCNGEKISVSRAKMKLFVKAFFTHSQNHTLYKAD